MNSIHIGEHQVGPGCPVYIVAEMSANHNGDLQRAREIVQAAKAAGADAIKLQTYTADTITLDSADEAFQIGAGNLWSGKTLHQLYEEACTPWEWHAELKELAEKLELGFFSSPFDVTSVEYLEKLGVPCYKIASFELVDLPLIESVAATGKPVIMSTGMATVEEIDEAIGTFREAGGDELILLKCTSAYPALPEAMNLNTIPAMRERFGVPVGLSDHTLTNESAIASVALGSCMIEKHFTIDRQQKGPDSAFSLEPREFAGLVRAVRATEAALGVPTFGSSASEAANRKFRKSLFVAAAMKSGEVFTAENVRCVRPALGLHPRHYKEVLGKKAAQDIPINTPLQREHVED